MCFLKLHIVINLHLHCHEYDMNCYQIFTPNGHCSELCTKSPENIRGGVGRSAMISFIGFSQDFINHNVPFADDTIYRNANSLSFFTFHKNRPTFIIFKTLK